MNVVVLAAGAIGSSTDTPWYLREKNSRIFLEDVVSTLGGLSIDRLCFCFRDLDIKRYHLQRVANFLSPRSLLVPVNDQVAGSAISCLLAVSTLSSDKPLLIVSANEIVKAEIPEIVKHFETSEFDGGCITFRSLNPRYSYVSRDSDGEIIEVVQQDPVSEEATTGLFWFRSTNYFKDAAEKMILNQVRTNGVFYIGPAFNQMILSGRKVGAVSIPEDNYIPLKTLDDLSRIG